MDNQLIYPFSKDTYKIIGACMEVHKNLKNGFLEAVYQEALAIEFEKQKIPYEREKRLKIWYKNVLLSKEYIADFLCFNCIIVEIKAIDFLMPEHSAQILNYLKITNHKIGLLINFGTVSLQYKRIIL